MRQIFWIIMIVVVVIFGAAWYIHRSKTHGATSQDAQVRGQAADQAKGDAAAPVTPPAETQDADTPAGKESQPVAAAAHASAPPQAPPQATTVAPPSTDSIPRNPPNGMSFSGTGKYQLYRQGDITWRLDTNSGQACILFATNAEWRKTKVFQHGCGS